MAKKLLAHLSDNNLIYEHQYGFLPGRSTEQNLLHVTNYITHALNDKMYCIGVFIDLRKAFDRAVEWGTSMRTPKLKKRP